MAGAASLAEDIIAMRLKVKTVKRYKTNVGDFVGYLQTNHAESSCYVAATDDAPHDVNLANVSPEEYKDFFGDKIIKRDRNGNDIGYMSFEHVSGFKSAIVDLHKKRRVEMPTECKATLSEFFAGYKRKIADLKQNGDLSTTEGKAAMTFPGDKFVAKEAASAERDFRSSMFAWTFLILAWNLMARSVSVSGIMFDHIQWVNDSLTIVFPKHKGDQDGSNAAPKHVYANPSNPTICPVLALAVWVFCIGMRREGTSRLLFGDVEKAENKFSKWLHAMCGDCVADLLLMGLIILDIGSHSFRKGIATFLSGIPGGPTAIAIYLRAGWSLGPVTSRYILEGGGGDELCGRAATGNSMNDYTFADLPPHFASGTPLTTAEWEDILPGYSTWYPQKFRQVLPFLFASLIYHRAWIEATFPREHPIFSMRVWTSGLMGRKAGSVLSGCMQNGDSGLVATGVPPHLVLANKIEQVRKACTVSV
jgi:hypothetical protein